MKKSIVIKNKLETTALIKVAPFRKEIQKTLPHKHNSYFEIIYLRQGGGTHTIDQTSFPIVPPTIFFIQQEQVHHWDMNAVPEGYVLLLKKGFVEQSLDGELKNLLLQATSRTCLHLNEQNTVETLFQLMVPEKDFTVIEGLLKALLAKIFNSTQQLRSDKQKAGNTIITSFRELLSDTDDLQNSVSHYARKLHVTPQNLNAICRKALGQSAKTVLSDHIIAEAKRFLLYTGHSVSEIAYRLHFSDTSHFVKYFKRHVGTTPQTFRNR